MKKVAITVIACLLLTGYLSAQESVPPFFLRHFGQFKKMMHHGITDGVVEVAEALNVPHLFAVGALADGAGEITAINGKLWLDYGADGLGKAIHTAPAGEKAMLLVLAQVEEWREITIKTDLNESDLHLFILAQAEQAGIDTKQPFPFLLAGNLRNLSWHVINGKNPHQAGGHHGGAPLLQKEHEQREMAEAKVVGFYSAAMQGVFTHPGESWHLHVVFENENKAGHIDALSVSQGTKLKLPIH